MVNVGVFDLLFLMMEEALLPLKKLIIFSRFKALWKLMVRFWLQLIIGVLNMLKWISWGIISIWSEGFFFLSIKKIWTYTTKKVLFTMILREFFMTVLTIVEATIVKSLDIPQRLSKVQFLRRFCLKTVLKCFFN